MRRSTKFQRVGKRCQRIDMRARSGQNYINYFY